MRLGSLIVLVWLVIGVIACAQRGYFKSDDPSCAKAGTVALTIAAGPLNYVDANPKVHDCTLPEPSR